MRGEDRVVGRQPVARRHDIVGSRRPQERARRAGTALDPVAARRRRLHRDHHGVARRRRPASRSGGEQHAVRRILRRQCPWASSRRRAPDPASRSRSGSVLRIAAIAGPGWPRDRRGRRGRRRRGVGAAPGEDDPPLHAATTADDDSIAGALRRETGKTEGNWRWLMTALAPASETAARALFTHERLSLFLAMFRDDCVNLTIHSCADFLK